MLTESYTGVQANILTGVRIVVDRRPVSSWCGDVGTPRCERARVMWVVEPEIAAGVSAGVMLGGLVAFRVLRTGWVRFRCADDLSRRHIERGIKLRGVVTSVGDGDKCVRESGQALGWGEFTLSPCSGSPCKAGFVRIRLCNGSCGCVYLAPAALWFTLDRA